MYYKANPHPRGGKQGAKLQWHQVCCFRLEGNLCEVCVAEFNLEASLEESLNELQ